MVERETGMALCQLGIHSRVVWMVIVFGLAHKLLYTLQESFPKSPRTNLSFIPRVPTDSQRKESERDRHNISTSVDVECSPGKGGQEAIKKEEGEAGAGS